MGYTLSILRMDFQRLNAVPGSGDAELIARLQPDLEELWDEDEFEEEDDEPLASPTEALQQILTGQVPEEEWGGEPYYQAVAALYSEIGTHLGELHFSSHEMGHLHEVDKTLVAAGGQSPLSLLRLATRGVPFRVPAGEPFPCLGYLTPEEVVEAHKQYKRISSVKMPDGIRCTVEQMAEWLRVASDYKQGLVGILG